MEAAEGAPPFLRPSADPDGLGRPGQYEALAAAGRGATGVVLKARTPSSNGSTPSKCSPQAEPRADDSSGNSVPVEDGDRFAIPSTRSQWAMAETV